MSDIEKRRIAEGLAMVRCVRQKVEILKTAVPGIDTVPLFKIIELQAKQAELALTGETEQ